MLLLPRINKEEATQNKAYVYSKMRKLTEEEKKIETEGNLL
ncbi:MAG: hypothetical protein ACLSA2_11835 [Candidatus Gastranaerophilaceae bacterium]